MITSPSWWGDQADVTIRTVVITTKKNRVITVKIDWKEHRERLAQMREKQDVSIKEYADLYGLNPNTARRHLGDGNTQVGKKVTPRSTARSTKAPRSTDHKGKTDRKGDQSAGKAASDASSKIKELTEQINRSKADTAAPVDQSPAAVLVGEVITAVTARTKSGRPSDQSKNGGRVLSGMLQPSDEDIAAARLLLEQAKVDAIEARLIESSLCSLFTLERTVAEMMAHLQDHQPQDGEPPAINKAVSVAAAAAATINDTARTLAAVRQSYAKDQREQALHLRKLSEPERVMEAYQRRKDEKWTAVETAIYIETHGYKVPSLLMDMARAEMKAGETDDSAANPVDLKTLDRQAQQNRAARLAALDIELAAKREAVAQLVDAGGHGDVAADGSLNDVNLTAAFDAGEEADDEINNLLYGVNDGHQPE